MKTITLSQAADADLEDIFDYTFEKYGLDQAVSYVSGFDDVFKIISGNPNTGRKRNEVREGLLSFVKEQHIIFYRNLDDCIRIVRILYGSRDLPKFLDQ